MLKNIGSTELIIIGVVLIMIFGGKKIAELARNLGESTKELEKVKEAYNKTIGNKAPPAGGQKKEDSGKAVKNEASASKNQGGKKEVKKPV